jgi:hypothetical protein
MLDWSVWRRLNEASIAVQTNAGWRHSWLTSTVSYVNINILNPWWRLNRQCWQQYTVYDAKETMEYNIFCQLLSVNEKAVRLRQQMVECDISRSVQSACSEQTGIKFELRVTCVIETMGIMYSRIDYWFYSLGIRSNDLLVGLFCPSTLTEI